MGPANEPVSVIIPAYNEQPSIRAVIEQVDRVLTNASIAHEIIVVDDGSTDETSSIAQQAGVHVIRHARNRGYGAAIKTGIKAAYYELLVIIDADGTYPVGCVPEILDRLQSADMVVGARVGQKVAIPLMRRPAKWILQRVAEYITGERIPDLNSGLRAFRRGLIQQYLNILPDKFSFTTTSTVAMLCDNYKVIYVPIEYFKRVGKSKIIPWDFVNFMTLIIRLSMLFHPLKMFVPIALLCMLAGGAKLLIDLIVALQRFEGVASFLEHPVVSTTTVIMLLAGIQILLIGMMSDGIARKITQSTSEKFESHAIEDLSDFFIKKSVPTVKDPIEAKKNNSIQPQ